MVRMKDIANDLGVSVMTVLRALRNYPDVSTATRAEVLKRAKELNYRPNLAARALVTGRTGLMGLVVPNLVHSFFAQLAVELSGVLRKQAFTLVISSSEEDPEVERPSSSSSPLRKPSSHECGQGPDCLWELAFRCPQFARPPGGRIGDKRRLSCGASLLLPSLLLLNRPLLDALANPATLNRMHSDEPL
jgi:hypothetical protein